MWRIQTIQACVETHEHNNNLNAAHFFNAFFFHLTSSVSANSFERFMHPTTYSVHNYCYHFLCAQKKSIQNTVIFAILFSTFYRTNKSFLVGVFFPYHFLLLNKKDQINLFSNLNEHWTFCIKIKKILYSQKKKQVFAVQTKGQHQQEEIVNTDWF